MTMPKKILIVDDLVTERINLRKILERAGSTTVEAKSGQEGVEAAAREMPVAIMMDVVMPEMSGFQATRAIKKNPATAGIPVIMVTTKNRDPDKMNAKDNGAVAYVIKPAAEADILAALKIAGVSP
jgi:twitching motility two-component system response regulator PilH